jgi:hypothetical protein
MSPLSVAFLGVVLRSTVPPRDAEDTLWAADAAFAAAENGATGVVEEVTTTAVDDDVTEGTAADVTEDTAADADGPALAFDGRLWEIVGRQRRYV